MVFELTEALTEKILFSMEDQNCKWMINASDSTVILQQKSDKENFVIDEENYYKLPEWNSGDGYALLENFTNGLHSPFARAELKEVLVSGRGVFRNFKNVLKDYPDVERKWHFFKDAHMRRRLMEWYNELRESWGLEKLEMSEIDESDELIKDDFVFNEYDSLRDRNDIALGITSVTDEYKRQFTGEIGDAVTFMWQNLSSIFNDNQKFGLVCRSQADEFSGCVLVAYCPISAKKTVTLTDFFVLQNYRGLGIGKELISKCLSNLKDLGVQWVLVANTIIPETMEPLLTQMGFEKLGSGFVVDLFSKEI